MYSPVMDLTIRQNFCREVKTQRDLLEKAEKCFKI